MWIGVSTDDKFGASYGIKGLLYGGPGNLSCGSSGIICGWGPEFRSGDTGFIKEQASKSNIKPRFN